MWGKDRLVTLRVRSPQAARCEVQMITHPGPSINSPFPRTESTDGRMHGAGATIALEPAATIQGVITAQGTNEPIAGCQVTVEQVPGSLMNVNGFATAVTDEAGQYVLDRLPLDPPIHEDLASASRRPRTLRTFRRRYRVRLHGQPTATHDAQLKPARWITGRVTDRRTGKPVRALVGYLPFVDNKNAEQYENFRPGMRTVLFDDFRWNNDDGTFQVPAIHGAWHTLCHGRTPGSLPMCGRVE